MQIHIKKEYLFTVLGLLGGGLVVFLYLSKSGYAKTVVDISTDKETDLYVDVSGAVTKPGVYKLARPALYHDAIYAAEGISHEADLVWVAKSLNLSTEILVNSKIYIPFVWEGNANKVDLKDLQKETTLSVETTQDALGPTDTDLLDINSANKAELDGLKGIGESYAQKILDGAPYVDFDDMAGRSGVPVGTLEKLKEQITFL